MADYIPLLVTLLTGVVGLIVGRLTAISERQSEHRQWLRDHRLSAFLDLLVLADRTQEAHRLRAMGATVNPPDSDEAFGRALASIVLFSDDIGHRAASSLFAAAYSEASPDKPNEAYVNAYALVTAVARTMLGVEDSRRVLKRHLRQLLTQANGRRKSRGT